jgi:hypothetical protein
MSMTTMATAIHPNGTPLSPLIPLPGSTQYHWGASHQDATTPLDAAATVGKVVAAATAKVFVMLGPKRIFRPDLPAPPGTAQLRPASTT